MRARDLQNWQKSAHLYRNESKKTSEKEESRRYPQMWMWIYHFIHTFFNQSCSQNIVSLQIIKALIQTCHRDLNIFSKYIVKIISLLLDTRDLEIIDRSCETVNINPKQSAFICNINLSITVYRILQLPRWKHTWCWLKLYSRLWISFEKVFGFLQLY